MTRKENLLVRKYELQNELAALKGEETVDINELTSGWRFHDTVKNSYEYRLKDDVERLQRLIEKQKVINEKNSKTEAFYNTEEGKELKKSLEKAIAELSAEQEKYESDALDNFKNWIKSLLGEYWTVKRLYDNCITFSVWDAEKKDYVFAQDIEVDCERRYWLSDNKERFETNVGTTGSFNLEEQNVGDRALFYRDLGKFLSNIEKLQELKKMMFLFADKRSMIRKAFKETEDRLENPLGIIY